MEILLVVGFMGIFLILSEPIEKRTIPYWVAMFLLGFAFTIYMINATTDRINCKENYGIIVHNGEQFLMSDLQFETICEDK